MSIVSAHKCDTGRQRQQNEDYIWVDEQTGVYIVADGMGGHEAGEVASRLAATTVGQQLVSQLQSESEPRPGAVLKERMTEAIEAANQLVIEAAHQAEQKRRMGAALIVALIQPKMAHISHVGDSRGYLLHGTTLTQLTDDDSWEAEFGDLAGGPTSKNPYTHLLTKAIGQESPLGPSFTEVPFIEDDWLLLCSDGLWNMVEEAQIVAILQAAGDEPGPAVEALVEAANAAGGQDNISAIAIKRLATS